MKHISRKKEPPVKAGQNEEKGSRSITTHANAKANLTEKDVRKIAEFQVH